MTSTEPSTLELVDLSIKGDVAVITFKNGKRNVLTLPFLDELDKALDLILRNEDVKILVTTGEGKFYSNGIDLTTLNKIELSIDGFLDRLNALCARFLTFPMPTVAAVNGHAFAGGMLIAMSHDYRVMNTAHGWISMNEVFMPQRLPPFLQELLKRKVPNGVAHTEVVALGRRFKAEEAFQRGIVQAVLPKDQLESKAIEMCRDLMKYGNYDRLGIHHIKVDLYRSLLDMLGKLENVLVLPSEYVALPKAKI